MSPEEIAQREKLIEAREQNLKDIEKSTSALLELHLSQASTADIFEKLARRLPQSKTITKAQREKWLQVFIAVFDALYEIEG